MRHRNGTQFRNAYQLAQTGRSVAGWFGHEAFQWRFAAALQRVSRAGDDVPGFSAYSSACNVQGNNLNSVIAYGTGSAPGIVESSTAPAGYNLFVANLMHAGIMMNGSIVSQGTASTAAAFNMTSTGTY
jgi:hypothetical protein